MERHLSFRGVLVIMLVTIALSSSTLVAVLSFRLYRQRVDQLNDQLTQQTLQRVTDRLDELVKLAIDHRQLYSQLVTDEHMHGEDLPKIFDRLWATVIHHEEISSLGVGIATSGEYAVLHRQKHKDPMIRMFLKHGVSGPVIREMRPTSSGLQLLQERPWKRQDADPFVDGMKSRRTYLQAVQARHGVWTDCYPLFGEDGSAAALGVSFATPVHDKQGQLDRVWNVDLELNSLTLFLDRVQQQVPGRLVILEHRSDGAWKLLAEPSVVANGMERESQRQLTQEMIKVLKKGEVDPSRLKNVTLVQGADRRRWQVAFSRLTGPDRPDWVIAGSWSEAALPHHPPWSDGWFLGAFCLVALISCVGAWQFARYIAAPLQTLDTEARRLAAGEQHEMPVVGGPDEIGRLSRTLNHLAKAIQQREQQVLRSQAELTLSQERLRAHIQNTPVGSMEIDSQGLITNWNHAAEHIFGWTADEVIGQRFDCLVPPDLLPAINQHFVRVAVENEPFRTSSQNLTKDGRRIDCEWYNTPLIEGGQLRRVACLMLDVTEQKLAVRQIREWNERLEQSVLERTQELQKAMSDLETFSYSVAHDLRTPLRAIDGFSEVLLEDAGAQLDPKSHDHLKRIRQAIRRMGELIDALLRLSRIARQEIRKEPVDLSSLVRQSINRFQQSEPERQVEVTIEPNLVVIGDKQLLRILVENLCHNAWKYSRPRNPATIEFRSELRADGLWYCVVDNGVGFDGDFVHKAFVPFERLHDLDQFEGHGIGLATAKRIVDKHGGELEAVSPCGALCRFRLPVVTNSQLAAKRDNGGLRSS